MMNEVETKKASYVVEPDFPVRFENWYQVMRHLVKHVLDGRKEKWEKYLGEEDVRAAREILRNYDSYTPSAREKWDYMMDYEYYHGLRKFPVIRRLADKYQDEVCRILRFACENDLWHVHLGQPKGCIVGNVFYKSYDSLEIHLASREEKMQIISICHVRNDRLTPHVLCTAFRCSPQTTEKAFQEYLNDRSCRKKMGIHSPKEVLAVHCSGKELCHD